MLDAPVDFFTERSSSTTTKKAVKKYERTGNRYGTIRAQRVGRNNAWLVLRQLWYAKFCFVSGLLRCRPSSTSARSDKSECIYTKESRLRHGGGEREGQDEKGWERELAWCQCLMKLSFPTRSLCHSSLPYSISLLAHGAQPHDSLFINAIGKTVEFASRHDLRRHGLYGTSSPFQGTHQNQRKIKMILFWFLTSINSQIL